MTGKAGQSVLVILGSTASGKSALAMELATRLGGEILCVDSMTVYRRLDIGTAKPSLEERQRVPHHLLDIVEPDEEFTVARFVEMADAAIADARRRGVPLIATGGTPLYYKSLFQGLFDGPAADVEIRNRLIASGNEAMHARLAEVDPEAAARIHVNDTKRLARALEVHELTGQSITSLQQEWTSGKLRHAATFVGLNWDKDELNKRINARVKLMIESGWLTEVQGLMADYPQLSRTAGGATGYAELIRHLRKGTPLEEALEQIKIATRQLARKQMKWFRRFEDVRWLSGARAIGDLADEVQTLWPPA